jgi:hypothetical protein
LDERKVDPDPGKGLQKGDAFVSSEVVARGKASVLSKPTSDFFCADA